MFSSENRCIYRSNQLGEVICQLRFPEILTISANLPVQFQEAIRDEFPQYLRRQENTAPRGTSAWKTSRPSPITSSPRLTASGVSISPAGSFP